MTEERLQYEIVRWWDANCERFEATPSDLAHIPNGMMSESARRRSLALGVRPGYPDLMLCVPRGAYHAMFIELKRPGRSVAGGLSADQRRILSRLRDLGYYTFACNSFDAAVEAITHYMENLS